EIIERAKQLAQCDAALDPFPIKALFLDKSAMYITEAIAEHAEKGVLIPPGKYSTFIRDGVESNGTTRNMASPALAGLVLEFFYTGPSALASLFPEVFAQEVPRSVVCLAATALRAAIDEYTITGVRQDRPFKYNTYSKVYTQFVGMQAKIDANSKHAALTQKLRIHWATTGR
ncbi:hypothetical protein SCLCIDRAFT_112427, partial [Scleroderma citrinum Foug A]